MNEGVNEIAYSILQNEYLKRKNIPITEQNLKELINVFPQDWFLKYSLEDRIRIISLALKNNLDLDEAIQIKVK